MFGSGALGFGVWGPRVRTTEWLLVEGEREPPGPVEHPPGVETVPVWRVLYVLLGPRAGPKIRSEQEHGHWLRP